METHLPRVDEKKRALYVILLSFTLLGVIYSAIVPIFEASDEVWHYPLVQHIAEHWTLPVQPLEAGVSSGPWRQEASQPPLYYAIAAILTAWIDTGDLEQVRHLNPHVAAGVATPDGNNVNLVVHNPTVERFPWRGTVLAVHIVRLFSVFLGTWAVYLTWALVRELFPEHPRLALTTAAIHAFTPMYLFISAAVNNDNLVVPLCSLALLMMVRLVKSQESTVASPQSNVKSYLALGVVIGLGLLTKSSAIALLPFAVATIAWQAWQNWKFGHGKWEIGNQHAGKFSISDLQSPIANLALVLIPAFAISGWWFYRNFRLYGDWLGLNAFYAVLGTRDIAADFAQLWAERFAFAAGYWGNFGGLNVPMPTWIYTVLNAFAILAGLNLVVRFGVWAVSSQSKVQSPKSKANSPISHQQIFNLSPLWPFAWDAQTAARALAWMWPVAVFVSWIRWATITWSSQGRLIFSAMPMWSLALALPMSPKSEVANHASSIKPYALRCAHFLPQMLAAFLFILCGVALPLWIAPAYTPPRETHAALTTPPWRVDFGNVLRLTGFKIDRRHTTPGDTVDLTLQWTALAPTATDHSLFIHVLGAGERIIAQRDTFPGRGLISTTWLEPGYTWIERYDIPISALAYAPDNLTFAVGMYETATGVRVPVQAATPCAVTPAGDAVTCGDVRLDETGQPLNVQFGKGIVLTSYDLSDVIVACGETLQATLHWHCTAPIDGDYTVSVQLIDDQWHKAAQSDAWPLDGAAPTSAWQVGQRIDEPRALPIAADAAPGVYNLQLALYRINATGELEHLPIVWEKGQMPVKTVVLTRVRVDSGAAVCAAPVQ
ncbi:MAG TPA: glycosyltransferase family 39 protein [Anaerolineae bacterium]|nr:glycosyltransferase family 39 protein [Anaerolineae bacterium]HQH39323.1 glycosyltransferase family 39 protein [Anaerolineae bacterium]